MKGKISTLMVAATSLAASIVMMPPTTNAAVAKVNCDQGGSLQDVFYRLSGNSLPLDVYVSGTCVENVSINGGPVWIFGQNNAVIEGTLRTGAHTVIVSDLKITGAGDGVVAERGTVYLFNVDVSANAGNGIVVNSGAWLQASDGSVISDNLYSGIFVGNGSVARLAGVEILDNTGNGVSTDNNASVRIDAGSKVSGNANGIDVYFHSSLVVEASEVSDNSYNGIRISKDSGVLSRGAVTLSNPVNVQCEDDESSFDDEGSNAFTAINCSGFN